jgi:hypothetical protein
MQNATILPCASWRLLVMATMMVTFGAVLPGTRSHAQQAPPPAEQTQSKAFSIERLEQLAAPVLRVVTALPRNAGALDTMNLSIVIPLRDEQFDFVVPRSRMNRPPVVAFRKLLGDESIRAELMKLGFR